MVAQMKEVFDGTVAQSRHRAAHLFEPVAGRTWTYKRGAIV